MGFKLSSMEQKFIEKVSKTYIIGGTFGMFVGDKAFATFFIGLGILGYYLATKKLEPDTQYKKSRH